MDDLPFALWLGMIPTVRVESKGSWGRLSRSPWLISSEYSSIPSTSGVEIKARRIRSPSLTGRLRYVWPSGRHYYFPSAYSFLPSWVLCKLPTSWLLGCEFLLPFLANIHAVSLVASSLPRPYPSPADGNKEGKTKEGSAKIIFSKNICISSPSRPCPDSSCSPTRWLSSLAGERRWR